jgi:hypothetical protein
VKPIPYPHPPPCVCRASTGFGWTVTAYTAVLSCAGMVQGFAGPARLLRVATGKVNAMDEGSEGDKTSREGGLPTLPGL